MPKILVARKLGGLYPVDEASENAVRKIGLGEIVTVDLKRPRNLQFHRQFFMMLHTILQNQEHYTSIDDLLEVCKLRIGHCHTVQTKLGEVKIPDSISFATMDENSFADFYDRACAWVVSEVIPGLERTNLDEEIRAQLMAFGAPEG